MSGGKTGKPAAENARIMNAATTASPRKEG